MQCPGCQHENPEGAKFCNACGARLIARCHGCAQENPPGAKFCNECGTLLTVPAPASQPVLPATTQAAAPPHAASALPAPPIPDAERRQLTVMFCDLADSTKLSGQLDPEDLREVIRAYQETAAGVIQRYEGHIAQYLGDGLLVYFGWPRAHEDDAQRGVHAGLDLLQAMGIGNDRLEQDTGIRLAVRIGLHTGPVVIGEMGGGGRYEHLALGETPNIAARLEGLAQPNTVVVSHTTYSLVEGYFRCDDLGVRVLKGVATPMHTYQVLHATGVQGRLDAVMSRGLTPMVGREAEIRLLVERWQQVKEGQGQVLLLSGEAGIGKSRLVQVLKEHMVGEAHTRLECRSAPYYQHTAFYPIIDLLKRMLHWQPDDSPHERLVKLEQGLQPSHLPCDESVALFASLLSLPVPEERYAPLNLPPQRHRQKILEILVATLVEQAERQSMLFILEDLHWTDPSTLEMLDLLIEQAPTASMMLLLTCRPEFAPPWGFRSHLTPMALSRFTRPQVARMVERVTGGKALPVDVVQQIVEKTDGVPLYVEELTKTVLEAGVLREVDGHYECPGAFSAIAIPATLQDALMARLDRLDTAKSVAQLGATIGRQFSYELLHAVSPFDVTTLQRELGQLVEAELVYQRGRPPHATYTFKHALVSDSAYQSLLRSTRQRYHLRIAEVLAARYPETQPELLAHHYTEAGSMEQAVDYWLQAGQRAWQRSAHMEAETHLRRGLELIMTQPDTTRRTQRELDFQMLRGSVFLASKGYSSPATGEVYARALALCQQLEESPQLFSVLYGLFINHLTRAELQTAHAFAEQLLSLAKRPPATDRLLVAHQALTATLYPCGQFLASLQHAEQGMALYHSDHHHALALEYAHDFGVVHRSYAAWNLHCLGALDKALALHNEALALAHKLSHPYSLGWILMQTARFHLYRRDMQVAHERIEALRTLCEEYGFGLLMQNIPVMQGRVLGLQGQTAEALTCLKQDEEKRRAAYLYRTLDFSWLAEAYGQNRQFQEGLHVLTEAQAIVEKTGERFHEAELSRLQGEFLRQQATPDTPQAEACFRKAITIAQSQHAKSWELCAATSLARLWQSQGKHQDAYDLLTPVYTWFTEGLDTADLMDAKALLEDLGR